MSLFHRFGFVFALAASFAVAQSPDSVRKEIETFYARALEALHNAKSMDDLYEISRAFDTQDWQSISPGQQPQIDTFELTGDIAV
jgi:hypothetical protein